MPPHAHLLEADDSGMLMLIFLHISDHGNRMTPLFRALENCRVEVEYIEIARKLVSMGADVNAVSM